MKRLARKAINSWINWRSRRAMERIPDIARLNAMERAERKRHGRVKHIMKQKQSVVTRALKGGYNA